MLGPPARGVERRVYRMANQLAGVANELASLTGRTSYLAFALNLWTPQKSRKTTATVV